MTKKMKKQGGFTLVEMLIVVAIIAILIAVSIPLVTGALDRAREATDAANVRAAKAEMTILYLSENADAIAGTTMAYDANSGSLKKLENAGSITGYGKVTTNTNNIIYVKYNTTDNVVQYLWAAAGTSEPSGTWSSELPTVSTTA